MNRHTATLKNQQPWHSMTVKRLGLTVEKSSSGFLMVIAPVSEDDSLGAADLSDYVSGNLVDEISCIDGVGSLQLLGSPYPMRIWLDSSLQAALEEHAYR